MASNTQITAQPYQNGLYITYHQAVRPPDYYIAHQLYLTDNQLYLIQSEFYLSLVPAKIKTTKPPAPLPTDLITYTQAYTQAYQQQKHTTLHETYPTPEEIIHDITQYLNNI